MANDTSTPTAQPVSDWHVRRDDEGGPAPVTPPRDLGQDWRPRQNGLD
ncbi:hypothetical protein [Mycolicibacterium sp. HK-90]|nr:hypothetical protein [Mycolicibacterium sp. HK-90]WKG01387.1 hypothetical protein QU592_19155 [Mycolicibacterium sp. HK-90]